MGDCEACNGLVGGTHSSGGLVGEGGCRMCVGWGARSVRVGVHVELCDVGHYFEYLAITFFAGNEGLSTTMSAQHACMTLSATKTLLPCSPLLHTRTIARTYTHSRPHTSRSCTQMSSRAPESCTNVPWTWPSSRGTAFGAPMPRDLVTQSRFYIGSLAERVLQLLTRALRP